MRHGAVALVALVAALACFMFTAGPAQAQNSPPASGVTIPAGFNQPPAGQTGASPTAGTDMPSNAKLPQSGMLTINGVNYYLTTKTQYEFWLAWMTVAIGAVAMILVCALFYRHLPTKTDDFVKLFAFVVVVFSAMFLIAVGYNDSQTAPVYSLLGTIIGYLFGREFTARQQQGAAGAAPEPAAHADQPSKP